MSFDKAKLLAYALGELDKSEAQRVEAFLRTNEEAARFVRESRLFAEKAQADLSKEKIPAGLGLAGLERAAERAKGKQPPRAQSKIPWLEASAGLLIVLAAIVYWLRPSLGIWQKPSHHADANLDFYEPTYSSLSGKGRREVRKALSAQQMKDSLAEWSNRPKAEEMFGECTFALPESTQAEAGLTKIAEEQKAWFYLMNEGATQVRLIMDASACTISLDIQANLSPEAQAEVEEALHGLESEMNLRVKDGR